MSEGSCPVTGHRAPTEVTHNHDWWPNRLSLAPLRANTPATSAKRSAGWR